MSSAVFDQSTGTPPDVAKGPVVTSEPATASSPYAALSLPNGGYSEDEFSYQPVPVSVSVAAGLVLLGLSSFLNEWLLILPLLGIVVAYFAARKIRTSQGAYSGGKACRLITGTAVTIIVAASSIHAYAYITEVPEGYERISFASDISAHGMKTVEGKVELPAAVQRLQDQPIFIKGYMYPSKQTTGITSFLLCKDSGDCCFGGAPKPTDMILVTFPQGQGVNYSAGLQAVAGKFTLANGAQADGQSPVYQLNAEKFYSPARTAY
ncbi:MAG: hypothetical protein C0478_01945 [Planctomyces sp.]|nr:hypothetical protein [Planctomyces sp.]